MSAKGAVEHMRALSEKSDDPINLIISSPGGHVESRDMLHDMIKFINPKMR
ncbi:MAG: ATP-dependent Clp protease proteolytic subunit, partial [Paracoccaceae bacterium]